MGAVEKQSLAFYRTMKLIREFEEHGLAMSLAGEIVGGIHPYVGQEAVATGICANLGAQDVITSTHRGHGHALAKGADPNRMLAELCGTTSGLNRGRGGSMHAADVSLGILGANGIVGAGVPIAAGAAWAAQQAGRDTVAVAFFGDGALSQGVVLEAFNLTATWSLPVLFVCENNGYATSLRLDRALAGTPVQRAAGFGLRAETVDGMDVEEVAAVAAGLIGACRAGSGPAFLECRTYRLHGHHSVEHQLSINYRNEEEVARWRTRDPLVIQRARVPQEAADSVDEEVARVIDDAVAFARSAAAPATADALSYLYADGTLPRQGAR